MAASTQPPISDADFDSLLDEVSSAKVENVVTRKAIHLMSADEQDRFAKAVNQMMTNQLGNGTSNFYKVALIHGSIDPETGRTWCPHGYQTFPVWHRIYMYKFEQLLQVELLCILNIYIYLL